MKSKMTKAPSVPRVQNIKTGKASGPKGRPTPSPKGGTRKTAVGNPKGDCP